MDERTEKIRRALREHGAELVNVTPLYGGACQENFKVELKHEGKELKLALRSDATRSLPGSIKRRDEFAVIDAAVKAGVRTPGARWLSTGLLREGADAYFLEWAPGEAIGRRVVREKELETARSRLPAELAQSLARLHGLEPSDAPSLPLGKPPERPSLAALTSLRAMLDQLPVPFPAVELCARWLEERAPPKEEVVLVHGDFRTGNFLVTPNGLAAILDWEFARWGSPYEDLAWLSVRDWRFGRLDRPIGGFARRDHFYTAYHAAGRPTVDESQVLWWEVMGNLRWAVGSAYQGERYLSGEARDLELIAIARRAVEMEWEALRLVRRGRL
ncbi:MAG: phosphotransferase family protein [Archangiaceae bacterium]|nr:phosphotransferase family protein [Archangiaceae bacterium]